MNKIILTGRLVKDADLVYLPKVGIPKTTFTLAVEREYQPDKKNKKVDFIPCEMIGKGKDKLAEYLSKGLKIMVVGELQINNYETDKETKYYTKVVVKSIEFLESKKDKEINHVDKFSEVPF